MKTPSPAAIGLVQQSLGRLAEQIGGYCRSQSEILRTMRGRERLREEARYLRNADRLLGQLDRLASLARDIPAVRRRLDLEALATDIAALRRLVSGVAVESAGRN